ncbi:MAG: hypothetical protein VX641_05070 [Planctomycetota bacterium]|nr:hypothetical protein [Planctomycetota bacterium]
MTHEDGMKPRKRTRTKLWITLSAVVVLILLLPTICSHVIVPGIIQSELEDSVDGTASVSGTSFSWFGSQRIDSITITSTDRATELELAVGVDRSLLGLLLDWTNLGTIDLTVRGKGQVFADGSTSLDSLARTPPSRTASASTTAGRSSGGGLPAGLNVRVNLSIPTFELEVVDQKTSLEIQRMTAEATVSAGGPLTVKLDTSILGNGRTGTVNLDLALENGIADTGRWQLTDATLTSSIKAGDLELPAGGTWIRISELELSANSTALSKGTQVRGTGAGTLDDASPISMKTTLDFGSLVAEDGGFAIGPDSISGTLEATSIPTTLIQPFLGDGALRLTRDIGPQVNLTMNAGSGTPRAITLAMNSARMNLTADLGVARNAISDGTMKLAWTLSPELMKTFGITGTARTDDRGARTDAGITASASGVNLSIADSGAPDLDTMAGSLTITSTGSLSYDGIGLEELDLQATTTGLARGVNVNLKAGVDRAQVSGTMQLAGLVSKGRIDAEAATAQGTLSLDGLNPGSYESMLGEALPPGTLADLTGGPARVEVAFDYAQTAATLTTTIGSPQLNGTIDAASSTDSIDVKSIDLVAAITPALLDHLLPEPNSIGKLEAPASFSITSKGLTYDRGADAATPLSDRIVGGLSASAKDVSFTLTDPAKTVDASGITANIDLKADHSLVLDAAGSLTVDARPVGSLNCTATVADLSNPGSAKLDARVEVEDVATVAAIAGTDPAPLLVLLGERAKLTLEAPASDGASEGLKLNGTIDSPKARGTFNALATSEEIERARLTFSTTLKPGDLRQAMGAKGGVTLGNTVAASVQLDASKLPLGGGSMKGFTANGTLSAEPMQLTGDNDSTVMVQGTSGTLEIRNGSMQADFQASIRGRDGRTGNGRMTVQTSATLPDGDQPFALGDTVVQLDSVPTFIFELAGANGRIAEAALGATVDSKATLTATDAEHQQLTAELKSPFASMQLPKARIQSTLIEIAEGQDLQAALTVSPQLGREVLSVIHPIFADISTAEKPITLDVGPLTLPLEGAQASQLNGKADLEIGRVTLRSTDFGSKILAFLGNQKTSSIPATFSPLRITATNGLVEYSDFVMELGEQASTRARRKLIFDGKINLAANPPTVIGISATFPAEWLKGSFKELDQVPPALLNTIQPKVTFYGPLYDARGNRIPLKSKIDPINLKDGLKPEAIPGIIEGIGDLINKNRNKKK